MTVSCHMHLIFVGLTFYFIFELWEDQKQFILFSTKPDTFYFVRSTSVFQYNKL